MALAKRNQINLPASPVQQGPRFVRLADSTDLGVASPAATLQWLANAEFSRQRWSARRTVGFALGLSALLWTAIAVAGFQIARLII